jgi:hypothetical protein
MPTYAALGLVSVGKFCFCCGLNLFFSIAKHLEGV